MISWDAYFDRTVAIRLDFAAARKALRAFEATPEAVTAFARAEINDLGLRIATGSSDTPGIPAERFEQLLAGSIRRTPDLMKGIEKRLRQHELLLRIATYESFMRDVHRGVLQHDPSRLRPDRKVDLGRLVAVGRDALIREEIEREVAGLDRKGVRETADYFRDRLGIDWSFGGTALPVLEELLRTRNTILHEDPEIDVPEEWLKACAAVLTAIPWLAVSQGAVLYPGAFQLPELMKREDAEKLVSKNRRRPSAGQGV
jgi:hypothetical protein